MNSVNEGSSVVTGTDRTPVSVWVAAALVSALRAAPFLAVRLSDPPPGRVFLPIGYIPNDWLSYVAFVRQAAESGGALLANPFTTDPQGGRFILLFHQALGAVAGVFGLDPFLALELARVPMVFLLFWVLWRLVRRVLPDPAHRLWAIGLIAFSGGVEALVEPTLGALPEMVSAVARLDFSPMFGWSTFQALFNPLWAAGLALVVPLLGQAIAPSPTARGLVGAAFGLLLLTFIHPYSAILVLAVVGLHPLLQAALAIPGAGRTIIRTWPPFAAALGVALAVTWWQLQDPVFRASSGGLFGIRIVTVFWYPVTFGAVLVFALRGWQRWIAERHPWALGLGAWTLAVVILHTSPVVNGYHFLYFLHIPLCIVAAPAAAHTMARLAQRPRWGRLAVAGVGLLLFGATPVVMVQSVGQALTVSKVSAETRAVVERLASEPEGNVLAPAEVGNLVPAFTPHHVYVGQWFLTPGYEDRVAEVQRIVYGGSVDAARLMALVRAQRLRYVVLPRRLAPAAARALEVLSPEIVPFETLALMLLRG